MNPEEVRARDILREVRLKTLEEVRSLVEKKIEVIRNTHRGCFDNWDRAKVCDILHDLANLKNELSQLKPSEKDRNTLTASGNGELPRCPSCGYNELQIEEDGSIRCSECLYVFRESGAGAESRNGTVEPDTDKQRQQTPVAVVSQRNSLPTTHSETSKRAENGEKIRRDGDRIPQNSGGGLSTLGSQTVPSSSETPKCEKCGKDINEHDFESKDNECMVPTFVQHHKSNFVPEPKCSCLKCHYCAVPKKIHDTMQTGRNKHQFIHNDFCPLSKPKEEMK